MNAQSIVKDGKCDTLSMFAIAEAIDVFLISETWAQDSISDAELSLNGKFNVFRSDRKVGRGGGVCLLIRNTHKCVRVDLQVNEEIPVEIVACDILHENKCMVRVMCSYFPNNDRSIVHRRQLLSEIVRCIDVVASVEAPCVITGDFNLPQIDWINLTWPRSNSEEVLSLEEILMNSIQLNGLDQLQLTPTRPASNNILDLVITNDPDKIVEMQTMLLPIDSDHSGIKFKINVGRRVTSDSCGPPRWNFHSADFEILTDSLCGVDWKLFFQSCLNVDDMYNLLVTFINELLLKYVELLDDSPKIDRLDDHIRNLLDLSDKFPREDSITIKLDKAVRRKRILEENEVINKSRRNPKDFFKYVRKRLALKDDLSVIKDPSGKPCTDDPDKALLLMNHFGRTYPSEAEKLRRDSTSIDVFGDAPENIEFINDIEFTEWDVYQKLSALEPKTSTTPEGLPAFFYKKCALGLAEPLSIIMNRSLTDSEVPELFRSAIVVPVHKGGPERDRVEMKRPVSLTVISCKIMEQIICSKVYANAEKQGLWIDEQFAYRPGRSAVGQLVETTNEWVNLLNKGHAVDVIYYDFKSAFETVTHSKLLKLLPHVGIGPKIVQWFGAFLRNRKFSVKVGHSFSKWMPVSSGCPQGTVAGPLAFNAYTNCLKKVLHEDTKIKVFADDNKMFSVVDNATQSSNLQMSIDNWTNAVATLDMELSIAKCGVLHLGKENVNYSYNIGGNTLPIMTEAKDLGITISNDLRFSEHITKVVKKSSVKANLILRSIIVKNPEPYDFLFKSLVLPTILYGSEVWFPQFTKDMVLLQKIVNRYYKRVEFRCNLSENHITRPNINDLMLQKDLKFFHGLLENGRMSKLFKLNQDTGGVSTRSNVSIFPLSMARSWNRGAQVASFFAWRLSTRLRYQMVG
jgi:exonuclease III